MLKKYFLVLLSPLLIISCSSGKTVNSSNSQPANAPPISVNAPANNANEVKSSLDVWSTEIEGCKPSRGCYSIKVNTLGKPTEIGFLYYRDNNNGTPIALTQATQAPLANMPILDVKKMIPDNFNVRVLLKSNGIFSGLETPSINPRFFPLRFSYGYYGDVKNFYKNFDTISYTIKSMTQLNSQEQAVVTKSALTQENEISRLEKMNIDTSSRHEFQRKDIQDISSGTITLKPQQVEPIVVGQKVGLKKW
jgi:hypothetical protein